MTNVCTTKRVLFTFSVLLELSFGRLLLTVGFVANEKENENENEKENERAQSEAKIGGVKRERARDHVFKYCILV